MDGIIPYNQLGIPDEFSGIWNEQNAQAFAAYERSLVLWEDLLGKDPSLARIPIEILTDPSKEKQVARMKRNFAFDRARVYLPVGVATNMFLLMSARSWVGLCQYLLSSPLLEANSLGGLIAQELELFAPRMTRHAVRKESTVKGLREEFGEAADKARSKLCDSVTVARQGDPAAYLDVFLPRGISGNDLALALANHENRYAWIGHQLRRTAVRFGWEAVGLAEIRDFNRHRTGTKYCPIVPAGFHAAADQWPVDDPEMAGEFSKTAEIGYFSTSQAVGVLRSGAPSYVYWMLLGTQLPFEHTTTGDKFVYEMELRTGTGAHYRYAGHCRDVLQLWYEKFPETKALIIEGAAEPE
jgi:hypothetical protein